MRFCLLLSVLVFGLGCGSTALAQGDAPRQLGGAPALPAPARPRPVAPPRQLGAVPAMPTDTTRRAAATAPAAPAAPSSVFTPPMPGQLPGNNATPTRFQVGLKNGTLYNATDVETKSPLFGHSYLLLDGQRKLDFADIGFYEDETGHYVRTTIPGSSRETTLRRDKTGRISIYSITTTQYNSSRSGFGYPSVGYGGYGMGGYGMGGYPGGYRNVKTEYFSKDNGPVQNMTTRNLMLATADNAGAQQLLAESRRYQQAVLGSYAVGGGLLLYGLLQSFKPSEGATGISPLVYVAIPVLIVPLVLQGKQAENQRQAIGIYNASAQR